MNISLKIDFTMRLAVCIYALRSSPDGLQIHLHHHFQTAAGISSARYLKFYHSRCICVNHRPSFRYKRLTFHNPYHKNDSCQNFLAQHINFMTSRAQFSKKYRGRYGTKRADSFQIKSEESALSIFTFTPPTDPSCQAAAPSP